MFIVKKLLTKINSRRIVKPSSKVIDKQFKENRIMNEENVKIAKIKKSCRVGKKVSGVMFIVCLVAAVACFISGVWIFAQGKNFAFYVIPEYLFVSEVFVLLLQLVYFSLGFL